jgi:Flp pilus assembly protein TadG
MPEQSKEWRSSYRHARNRRSGIALVYVAVVISAMMGFCSLVVDLGRYQSAHQQLYNAAMAAARAGAAAMAKSGSTTTTVSSAAKAVTGENYVDGQSIPVGDVTVEYLNWTSASTYTVESAQNYASANAVRVTITYNVPLLFAKVLGINTKTASEASVAKVVVNVANPTVYATGDIWLANEPTGTTASQADPNYSVSNPDPDHKYPHDIAGPVNTCLSGVTNSLANYSVSQPYSSPVKVGFTVTPGATITITNCSGNASYDHDTSPYVDATGNTGSTWICNNYKANYGSEHGISDAVMPIGSMNAVFTGSAAPDGIATPPPYLDFTSQSARDYVALAPKLQQAFYTGTGTTSGGQQQQIVVPTGASYLFMGVMDAWEWDNNSGSFTCTVTQTYITTVQ